MSIHFPTIKKFHQLEVPASQLLLTPRCYPDHDQSQTTDKHFNSKKDSNSPGPR